MNYRIILFFALMSSFFAILQTSCTADKLPKIEEPEFCDTLVLNYQLDIKPIVDTYCSYSGCHDGSAPGEFETYSGLLPFLESGSVEGRVITNRDMPPNYANAGFTELLPEEYDIFNCWISQGYPE